MRGFFRPNQAKNQIIFPVLKREKVAGFMPVSIHAFLLVPLQILDLRAGAKRKNPKRSY
jgi:hypothetical protein